MGSGFRHSGLLRICFSGWFGEISVKGTDFGIEGSAYYYQSQTTAGPYYPGSYSVKLHLDYLLYHKQPEVPPKSYSPPKS